MDDENDLWDEADCLAVIVGRDDVLYAKSTAFQVWKTLGLQLESCMYIVGVAIDLAVWLWVGGHAVCLLWKRDPCTGQQEESRLFKTIGVPVKEESRSTSFDTPLKKQGI